ncbi:LysM peptidoglycan-binding domain-containing protein [Fonticella tunisiensis]|uniref:LysM domain-containing protein n=1 Tax=Fonticella tunisiensis TaxID=1096341 RepID=A0A4R7KUJ3_9CLOT|nr:LysM peptidoglycan-binding domain-containing protein [Fonticella tunisiensis]TDT63394.1 LysM domain-containing protein [Fonticella tunisiensis]
MCKKKNGVKFLLILAVSIGVLTISIYRGIELYTSKNEKFSYAYQVHVVMPGETLWDISKQYKTPDQDIRELIYNIRQANKLDSVIIKPGQEILIPKTKEDGGN